MNTIRNSLLALVALAGCQSPPYDASPYFNEAEFKWAIQPGTSTLKGQAFVRTNGGDVKACAATEIYLVPQTAYTNEIARAQRAGIVRFADNPVPYARYRRSVIGGANGDFEFTGLPAGRWYVGCYLSWMTTCTGWSCQWAHYHLEEEVTTQERSVTSVLVTGMANRPAAAPTPKACSTPLWC